MIQQKQQNLPKSLCSTLSGTEYYIGDQINSGAEGIIYKGYFFNEEKQIQVAIKMSENMKDDEMQFLDQLSIDPKPNLITCYDVIINKKQKPTKVYTIMELADIDLFKYLPLYRSILSEEEKLKISIDVVRGLKQLHELNFFHRDLKPENVLKVGNVWKLCDFGLAKHQISFAQTKNIGTPYYLSPEMIDFYQNNNRDYGQEIDMWAFGCLLYEIFTGNVFFDGDSYDKIIESIKSFCNQFQHSDYKITDQKFEQLQDEKIKNICKKLFVVNSQKRLTSSITLQLLENLNTYSIQQIDQIYQKEFNNNIQTNSQTNKIQQPFPQNNKTVFQQSQTFQNRTSTNMFPNSNQQQNQNFQQLNNQIPQIQTFNNPQISKFPQNFNQNQIQQESKDQQHSKNNSLTLQPQTNQNFNINQKTFQPQTNQIINQMTIQPQINENMSNNQIFSGFQSNQVDSKQQFQSKQGPQTFVAEKKPDAVANQVDTAVKPVSFHQAPQKQDLPTQNMTNQQTLKKSTESKQNFPVFQQNQNNLEANVQNKQTLQNEQQGIQGFGFQAKPQTGANEQFDPFKTPSTQQNQFSRKSHFY